MRPTCWTILFILALSLEACGPSEMKKNSLENFRIAIELPHGVDNKVFWYGVDSKELVFRSEEGHEIRSSLERANDLAIDATASGEISFEGRDANKYLLVFGKSKLGAGSTGVLIKVKRYYN